MRHDWWHYLVHFPMITSKTRFLLFFVSKMNTFYCFVSVGFFLFFILEMLLERCFPGIRLIDADRVVRLSFGESLQPLFIHWTLPSPSTEIRRIHFGPRSRKSGQFFESLIHFRGARDVFSRFNPIELSSNISVKYLFSSLLPFILYFFTSHPTRP